MSRALRGETERWRRVALQAAEQSRRTTPPEIADPIKFSDAVGLTGGVRIVLSESEQKTQLCEAAESESADEKTILAVGPEGGWTAEELRQFQQAGWISASLGAMILRAETAAIAAAAILISGQR